MDEFRAFRKEHQECLMTNEDHRSAAVRAEAVRAKLEADLDGVSAELAATENELKELGHSFEEADRERGWFRGQYQDTAGQLTEARKDLDELRASEYHAT